MKVVRSTTKDIEALNINDFFTGHTLAKDKEGMHYYSCERYCMSNPEIMAEPTEEDSEELIAMRVLFESLEKVELEEIEIIHQRIKPVIEKFGPNKILLSSECGFGHVPIEITRGKLSRLVEASRKY